jgi:GNAT superfamily N-acetyltransferase
MNRLVVIKSHRGHGIGKQLDQVRIQQGKASGAQTIIVAPVISPSRKHSLEAQGFCVHVERLGRAVWSPTVQICPCYLPVFSMEQTPR